MHRRQSAVLLRDRRHEEPSYLGPPLCSREQLAQSPRLVASGKLVCLVSRNPSRSGVGGDDFIACQALGVAGRSTKPPKILADKCLPPPLPVLKRWHINDLGA